MDGIKNGGQPNRCLTLSLVIKTTYPSSPVGLRSEQNTVMLTDKSKSLQITFLSSVSPDNIPMRSHYQ